MPSRHLTVGALWMLVAAETVCATEVPFPSAPPASISITAELRERADGGPYPAVILLHTGGGVGGDRQLGNYQDRPLATRPRADGTRIGIIGASDGGRVALELAAGLAPNAPTPRAVVVYYPACPRRPVMTLQSPVLVHEAELDDWPVQCRTWFTRLTDAGAPLRIYRYRARHGFDNPALAVLLQTPGGSLEYDAPSERDAWTRTLDFLRQHLGP